MLNTHVFLLISCFNVYDNVLHLKYKCCTSVEVIRMAIVQFRVADAVKKEATEVYEKLGLDLSSAIRMFLVRSISENGLPFPVNNLTDIQERQTDPIKIMEKCQEFAKLTGDDRLTLDEINEIIHQTREEVRKEKRNITQ